MTTLKFNNLHGSILFLQHLGAAALITTPGAQVRTSWLLVCVNAQENIQYTNCGISLLT
jgi:hypothetical protein